MQMFFVILPIAFLISAVWYVFWYLPLLLVALVARMILFVAVLLTHGKMAAQRGWNY
jgi:hypothetical protein